MHKHIKKIIVACLLITILNFIYSVSNKNIDYFPGKNIIPGFSIGTGKQTITKKTSIVGYHKDLENNFVILQQQPDDLSQFQDVEATHFWQFQQSDFVQTDSSNKYDIKLVNGYDYNDDGLVMQSFDKLSNLSHIELAEYEVNFLDSFVEFFNELLETIQKSDPKIESINNDAHYAEAKKSNKYPNNNGRVMLYGGHLRENYLEEPIRTKEMLSNYLVLSEDEHKALKKSHESFLSNMPTSMPEKLLTFGSHSHFMKGDGIVYLGGDRYNQLVLLSIKTLRSSGSRLPVEVIIPKRNDFDLDLCLKILPKLNAKCKIMSDYLPSSFIEHIKGYQMKNIALLISSFEKILYLDADNLPIKNPDSFFTNKPFTNKHLVIWPDLWRRSTSPNFYDIANIEIDREIKVRNSYFENDSRGKPPNPEQYSFHDCKGSIPEASSETGQLLINKKVHFKTLILSMYYNYYGPNYYYPLLSQGAAGEGDKETFIAAAHKLKLPYYQIKEFNREFGPINSGTKKHEFFGMGQYDPIVDYIQANEENENEPSEVAHAYYNDDAPTYGKNDRDNSINNYNYHLFKSSSLFFLHANWPKYLIREMFIDNSYGRGPKDGNQRRRLYNKDLLNELNGYDFELHVMNNAKWCFCDLSNINLKGVPESGSDDRKKICEQIGEQIKFLESNS